MEGVRTRFVAAEHWQFLEHHCARRGVRRYEECPLAETCAVWVGMAERGSTASVRPAEWFHSSIGAALVRPLY